MADRRRNNRRPTKKKKGRIKRTYTFSKVNSRRLSIVFCFMILCFAVLIGRLVQIYRVDRENYQKNVLVIQSGNSQTLAAKRGEILDRNGNVLAAGEMVYNIILDPSVITGKDVQLSTDVKESTKVLETTAEVLEDLFDIDKDEVINIVKNDPSCQYYILKQNVSYEEKKKYDDLEHSEDEEDQAIFKIIDRCFLFEEKYTRKYNYSTLACDVLGFTSDDGIGQAGLEYEYDSILSGTDGKEVGYINENIDLDMETHAAKNGKNLVTTLDLNIQRITEKYIAEFMDETGAKNIAAIVMNPNNGEILAMASAPVFDCNSPHDATVAYCYDDDKHPYSKKEYKEMDEAEQSAAIQQIWRNFCVNETYEPGSTSKVLTVSYAMDHAFAKKTDKYECDGGQYYEDGTYVSCNDYHGSLTLAGSLIWSCNDAMMQISDKIGTEGFLDLFDCFGLGQYTHIDLPGESAGVIFNEDTMGPVELWTSSFGQGDNVTMIQLAAAFSSIVNGGNYYEPHIVSSIQSDSGETETVYEKKLVRNTISAETSEWMRDTLYATVEEGTGHYAQVSGYKIGGKTGTAQKIPRDSDARLVSFISAAPIDDPQLVIYVVVDEPNAEDQGQSSFAQIIAGKIYAEALPYLQIFPTETLDDSRISYSAEEDNKKETAETDENGEVIENPDEDEEDQEEYDEDAYDQEDYSDGEDSGEDSDWTSDEDAYEEDGEEGYQEDYDIEYDDGNQDDEYSDDEEEYYDEE